MQEIRTPSSRCGGPRCELEMRVMMVVRGVDIVGVIAMRTTTLREPTTVVSIPVGIPFRIPPEIQFFHFQEDLQKNNRGPMRKTPHPIYKTKRQVRVGNQRECKSDSLQGSYVFFRVGPRYHCNDGDADRSHHLGHSHEDNTLPGTHCTWRHARVDDT